MSDLDELIVAIRSDAAVGRAWNDDDPFDELVARIVAFTGERIALKILAWPDDSSVPVGVIAALVKEWTT